MLLWQLKGWYLKRLAHNTIQHVTVAFIVQLHEALHISVSGPQLCRVFKFHFSALRHHLAENTTNKTSHVLSQQCGTDKYLLSIFPTLVRGLALYGLTALFCQLNTS